MNGTSLYPVLVRGCALSALAAVLFAAASLPANCQQQPADNKQPAGTSTPMADKLVSIDTERGRLVDILPDLMKSVGADYSLDADVKNVQVTIHISKAKFKVALDAMMKVCDSPVSYKEDNGLYHFMARREEPEAPPSPVADRVNMPARRGPLYNGGDPLSAATSELFQFLAGSEPALTGKSPFPDNTNVRAGTGSLSGSRSYSEFGFINGRITSSSFETADMADPTYTVFGGGYGYFGPIGNGSGGRRR